MREYIIKSTTAIILSSVIGLAGCSSSDSSAPPATPIGDISGVWAISETTTSQTVGCSGFDSYDLTFAQNINAVTITDEDSSVFNGTLSGNTLTWSGSFPEPPGTVSTNVTLTIDASCSALSGSFTFTYSETGFSCSGTATITGNRTSGGTSC